MSRLIFASSIVGCILLGTARPSNAGNGVPAPGDGEKVFAAQKCSLCHSIAGKGNKLGPLDGVGSKLTAEEIRNWIVDPAAMATKHKATRKPPMKPVASLTKADVDALVDYLQTLKKK
jgi:mono/diheme cytochrome c family protein